MKKYILGFFCAIEVLLFSFFVYSTLHPGTIQKTKVYKTDSLVTIGNITNEKIEQEFVSNLDILDSISVTYANFTHKITQGNLDVEIYDYKDKLIYDNNYDLTKLKDNETLKFEFDILNNVRNKKFKLILDFNDMAKKEYVTVYGQDIKSDKNLFRINDENYVVRVAQYGQEKSHLYSILSGSIFFFILLGLLFTILKNKVSFCFSGYKLLIQSVVLLLISLFTAYTLLNVCIANFHFGQTVLVLTLLVFLGISLIVTNLALVLASKNFKIQNLFLALAIPIGIFYMLFVIPSNVPDEPFHYAMSYQVGVGNLSMEGGKLPSEGTQEYSRYITYKYHLNGVVKDKTGSVKNPYDAIYNPVLYLFSGFGIFIGNLFNTSIMMTKLLGCFFNFLLFILVGYYIVKKISFGKCLMLVYLLNPMNMQQVTSLSCDCVINMGSLLLITLLVNMINKKESINIKSSLLLAIPMLFVLLSKNAYFPIAFMLILLFKNFKSSSKKEKIVFILMLVVVFVLYGLLNNSVPISFKTSGSVKHVQPKYTKLGFLFTTKTNIIYLIYHTLHSQGSYYLLSFTGTYLGALRISVPTVISFIYVITLIISLFNDEDENNLSKKSKIFIFIIFLINLGVIFGGLFLGWGGNRTLLVEGIQGRYFIPVTILPLLLLINRNNKIALSNKEYLITILLVFIHLVSLYHVIWYFLY